MNYCLFNLLNLLSLYMPLSPCRILGNIIFRLVPCVIQRMPENDVRSTTLNNVNASIDESV